MLTASVRALQKEFRRLSNPQKAKLLSRYFKTGKGEYAEGDHFYGVTVPQVRVLVKKFADHLSFSDIEYFLKTGRHEERLCALLILVEQFKGADEAKRGRIYRFYLSHTAHINNWDLVDLSAPRIVGAYLEGKPKLILHKLARSKNLWERRIAILATFHDIYYGECREALGIAEMLLHDTHDLIHKAVGWMLREVGKRCGEKYLEKFLGGHCRTMPRTMLRYALERFPEKKRESYLHTKRIDVIR